MVAYLLDQQQHSQTTRESNHLSRSLLQEEKICNTGTGTGTGTESRATWILGGVGTTSTCRRARLHVATRWVEDVPQVSVQQRRDVDERERGGPCLSC